MKIIKTIIMMFVFMMTISSVFSAGLFNSGCWFNDNPNLIFDVLVYNPDGTFKSSITLDKNTNLDLSINENDIVKVDLSKLTDNQNNIKSEEIYWLNSKRNDLKIGIQDNTNILTNLVNQSFSLNKFDFLNYLTNGLQSNQEYYQTNVKSISYNNGNPQSDFIETFKPNVGTYKMLVKTYDSCKGYPQDEVYKIFNINVKKSITVPIIPPTTNISNNNYSIQDNFNRLNSNNVGTATNGNNWGISNSWSITNNIANAYSINNNSLSFSENAINNYNPSITLQFNNYSYNYVSFDFTKNKNMLSQIWINLFSNGFLSSGGNLGFNDGLDFQIGTNLIYIQVGTSHNIEFKNIDVKTKSYDVYLDGNYIKNYKENNLNVNGFLNGIVFSGFLLNSETFSNAYSFDNIIAKYVPNVNVCNGILNLSKNNQDIFIKDNCSRINNNLPFINSVNLYYNGTLYNINNRKNIELFSSYGGNVNLYTNVLNINETPSSNIKINGNGNIVNGNIVNGNNLNGNINVIPYGYIQIDGNTMNINSSNSFFSKNDFSYNNINDNNNLIVFGNQQFNNFSFTNNHINSYDLNLKFSKLLNGKRDISNNIFNINGGTYKNYLNMFHTPTTSNGVLNLNFGSTNNYNPSKIRNYDIYSNIFKFKNNYNITFSLQGSPLNTSVYLGKNINGKYLGNYYINNNGNDIFNCNSTLNTIINNGKTYKVCSQPVLIKENKYSNQFSGNYTMSLYDYIIVTNASNGGIPLNNILNKNPVAILIFNGSNQVNVGDTICWDSTSSYDSDGTIVSKQIIEGNNTYTNKDSNCLTRNTSSIIDLRLTVTDNNGATNSVIKNLKWNKLPIYCSANIPPTLVLSKTNIGNNYYWLNMTTIDLNNDSLLTSWSVNGNIVNGKNVLQHIDYTQDIFGYAYDGCNITSNFMNINVGINQSNSLNSLTSNLLCNNDNIYPNSNLNCNLKYNLNGRILNNITWNYDNNIINNNSENFTKIITDTNYHIISVTLNTNNGDSITKYFNFNLIPLPQTNNGGGNINNGGGSGGSTTKNNCDIIVNPNQIKVDNNNLIQVSFNNNEIGSWTPDYSFNSIIDVNSSKSRLSITNVFGTFNSKQTKIIGIKYTQDILNQNSIYTKDNLVLTSTNCRDIIIPIEVNISQQQISSFVSPTILSSIKNGNLFTNSVLTKKQIPVGNNLIDKFKIWHLVSMIFMFFTFIFWGVKYSRNKIGNSVLVISSIILTTTFVSTLLIYVIRTFIGKL